MKEAMKMMQNQWKKQFCKGAAYKWRITGRHYANFTDLGRYVIDCDRHRNFNFERAREYINARLDLLGETGCTAFATRANNGDVLIGRNLDLLVSQMPCYITHVKYGKYDTLNFTYDEISSSAVRYRDLLRRGRIDAQMYNALPMLASDSMNECGLYMEYNMRDYEDQFICTGTNPDCLTRACTVSLPFLVTSNCATVDEAVQYMKNELDLYTMLDQSVASGWNLCCVIGDAVGNYGLIEIANNEIKYLPQQHGQGNYYVYPEFNSVSRNQSGYGRLQFGLERIDKIQNEQQMADLMKQVMWRNEILKIPYAYRDSQGHIHFCADPEHKIPSLDWRSDQVRLLPVNENGEYVDVDGFSPESRVVREYKRCYERYLAGDESPRNQAGYAKYKEYLDRCDLVWVQTNDHFEDLQAGLIKHYEEKGALRKYARFYAGDEDPLREDRTLFTTSLSISANCTQKRMTVMFWENPTTVMTYQW